MIDDLVHGARWLVRQWRYAGPAALTLALGLGANTTLLTVAQGVLLRPLPYTEPERIVTISRTPRDGVGPLRSVVSPSDVRAWRNVSEVFTDLAASEESLSSQVDFVGGSQAERLHGRFATTNFFQVLGVKARLGRTFLDDDDIGAVVLSDGFWRRALGGDPAVVGASIDLTLGRMVDGRIVRRQERFTVLGVLEREFHFSYPQEVEVWLPITWADVAAAPAPALLYRVVARLRDSVTLEQAGLGLAGVDDERGLSTTSRPVVERIHASTIGTSLPDAAPPGATSRPGERLAEAVSLLLGIGMFVIVLSCLNVSNLLIANTAARRHETALRLALGATRIRLLRQLMIESVILGLTASVAALAVTVLFRPVLHRILPPTLPRFDEVDVDLTVMGWSLCIGFLSSLLVGLGPVLYIAHSNQLSGLKRWMPAGTTAGFIGRRWRHFTVTAQVAVVFILVTCGTWLLRSFMELQAADLGFDGEQVLLAEMRVLNPPYRGDPEERRRFDESLLERVRALPDVIVASIASSVPMHGSEPLRGYQLPNGERLTLRERSVEADYFAVMRIRLLAGRVFAGTDTATSQPVAIVSRSLARAHFPNANPVGQLLQFVAESREIVGVVEDVRQVRVEDAGVPAFYVPRSQEPSEVVALIVRTEGEPMALVPAIRTIVRNIDPKQPIQTVTTLDRLVAQSIASRRFFSIATAIFALIGLLIAMAGLFGVVSGVTSERTREFGIRRALGASTWRVISVVLLGGLRPVAAGIVVGGALTTTAITLIRTRHFGLAAADSASFIISATAIAVLALACCTIPALRAAWVEPAIAIRDE